jgi:hypothetical protein
MEKLEEFKKQKKILSIYADINNTNKFAAGCIAGVDKNYFILSSVTPAGTYDGFLLKRIDSVYKISTDGLYNNKLLKLIDFNNIKLNITFESDNLVKELLEFAQKQCMITSIELVDSGYDDCVGLIESIENEFCTIQEINEYGDLDEQSIIKISDITKLSCDEYDYYSLKLLYESNKLDSRKK